MEGIPEGVHSCFLCLASMNNGSVMTEIHFVDCGIVALATVRRRLFVPLACHIQKGGMSP